MSGCTRIVRLIHLHREGERSAAEDRMVLDHVARCGACAGLLRSVERAGEAIAAARSDDETVAAGPGLVDRTIAEITRTGGTSPHRAGAVPARGMGRGGATAGFGFQPAISFMLICALVLVGQQGRDALESAGMERRLAGLSAATGTDPAGILDLLLRSTESFLSQRAGVRPSPVVNASTVPRFLVPGLDRGDLFREYAGKYPRLAAVNPYDGIDERERAVLESEGKAFLDEFRSIVRQGE